MGCDEVIIIIFVSMQNMGLCDNATPGLLLLFFWFTDGSRLGADRAGRHRRGRL